MPAVQVRPLAQALSQAPQFVLLVARSTHVPPHIDCPLGHTQLPAMHDCPLGHALPHAPQSVALVFVSTQLEPHSICPVPQLIAHVPPRHT
jgi:hypothetical protein